MGKADIALKNDECAGVRPDISTQARTVSEMADSIAVSVEKRPSVSLLPIRSSIRRSSGWKRISNAISPSSIAFA